MKQTRRNYLIFNFVNFTYLLFGVGLVVSGILLLTDTEKILLSRLIPVNTKEPLFYYLCLFALYLGILVVSISFCGCWATYKNNYYILAVYIFMVLILLLAECVIGIVAAICPEYFGLKFDVEQMLDLWQRKYGVPGREQYTAAIDLIQTKMECCGVMGSSDFSVSWWRVRDLAAPNLTVPLSCCFQDKNITNSFLDPVPVNNSLCQEMTSEKYRFARYTQGCSVFIEEWLYSQRNIVLSLLILKTAVQLLIIFSIIVICIKKSKVMSPYVSPTNKDRY